MSIRKSVVSSTTRKEEGGPVREGGGHDEARRVVMGWVPAYAGTTGSAGMTSVPEQRRVFLLDLRDLRQHRAWIVGQQLDSRERRAVGRLLHVRVHGAQPAFVHQQL